jgi:hypothetical protein
MGDGVLGQRITRLCRCLSVFSPWHFCHFSICGTEARKFVGSGVGGVGSTFCG